MNKYEDEIMIRALLTIDDVSSNNTPAIVDYLNGKNIPAIMFMVGQWAENHPAELIYALQHGMIVGNHSYTHPHFSEISFEECKKEIEKNEEVLNKFYAEAGVERKYRPFRFPYGDKGGDNKALIQEYLSQQGFDKVDDTKFGYPFWTEGGHNKDIDTFWTFDFAEYNIRPGSGFGLEDVMKSASTIRNPRQVLRFWLTEAATCCSFMRTMRRKPWFLSTTRSLSKNC